MPAHRQLRLVVLAEESAGVQVLEALRSGPEAPDVVAVVTQLEEESDRPLVAAAAARLGLQVLSPSVLGSGSFSDFVSDLDVDLLLNVHSLVVLSPDVVRAPRIGSFNLHPGPLPEYAGLNAPSWAIYEGRTSHAVTLHWMDAGVDTGAIAYRASFAIDDADTGLSLTVKCVRHGMPLVSRLIADARRGASSIPMLEQDLRKRRYFGREIPNEGKLVWSVPARDIVRFVRAADYSPFASPWGIPWAQLADRPVGIAKASLSGEAAHEPAGTVGGVAENGAVLVAAADEWVAVRRMWRDGGYVAASTICSPGDVLRNG